MTPKEYKNKMMVKVVGSTRETSTIAKKMIGEISEVEHIDYAKSLFYIRQENNLFGFNLSDVQIATPVMYEGKTEICVGDKIKIQDDYSSKWHEVIDFIWWNDEWEVVTESFIRGNSGITKLDPLYKEVKDEELKTIIIDGQNYKLTKI